MTTSQSLKDAGKRTITGLATDADWISRLTVLEKTSGTMLGTNASGTVNLSVAIILAANASKSMIGSRSSTWSLEGNRY